MTTRIHLRSTLVTAMIATAVVLWMRQTPRQIKPAEDAANRIRPSISSEDWTKAAAILRAIPAPEARAVEIFGEGLGNFALQSCSVDLINAVADKGIPLPKQYSSVSSLKHVLVSCPEDSRADLVRLLAQHGVDVNDLRSDEEPMFSLQKIAILQALLDTGMNPNRKLENGTPLLEEAMLEGNVDAASLLLAKGADLAGIREPEKLIPFLIQNMKSANPWFRTLAVMFQQHGWLERRVDEDRTPLACAVLFRDIHAVQILLDLGAEPNPTLKDGRTLVEEEFFLALDDARWEPVLKRSLREGTNMALHSSPNQPMKRTMLAVAIENVGTKDFNPGVIRVLLEMGARADEPLYTSLSEKDSFVRQVVASTAGMFLPVAPSVWRAYFDGQPILPAHYLAICKTTAVLAERLELGQQGKPQAEIDRAQEAMERVYNQVLEIFNTGAPQRGARNVGGER